MAEWIEKEEVAPTWLGFLMAKCSNCGKYVCTPTVNSEYFQYKYCPHCGDPMKCGVDERHVEDENNEKKRKRTRQLNL